MNSLRMTHLGAGWQATPKATRVKQPQLQVNTHTHTRSAIKSFHY